MRDQGLIPKSICDIALSMRHSENITITTLEEGKIHLKRMMLNERTSRKRGQIFLHVSTDTKTLYVMTDVGLGSPETNRCHSLFLVAIVKCVKSQCQVPRALSKPYTKKWVSAAATGGVKAKQKCLSNPLGEPFAGW